ncbi:CDP-diacylglycerol--glycerol-3-phosphate 3-phosphatidyltransferase [Thermoflavimicrobium dichotomicum]|uniref:CDP-diacylglycerol--glycerol-3-phosphate 3-phosphatidyltransferase n=1 Tax=Thermoflavimicrobium dichotomicum TaxID=46223 RepID=A0A1I3K058_9BACL|nr:CDP-diacylglycerol--glycerol-3-phosphate 3-phosphatidyltransferase [Thermoflavimicrobium dichotomicum]SFI65891.1 cardiolipin synthase [Thermoflavimicrobium dichotomicum]
MNLPNLLTLIRFIMVPLYLYVFFSDLLPPQVRMFWAMGIILFAGATDIADGYLARRNRQVTQLGTMLDPLADKLMIIAVFASLLISGKIGLWAAIAIVFRDVAMIICSIIFHLRGKKTVPANIFGKITTVFYYIALFLLMFDFSLAESFLWFVIGLSYFTSIVYMFQIKGINERWM